MKIAVLCTAFLALLQICLGITISRLRRKHKISVGCPDDVDHPLYRVSTAYRNCAEWHPMFMALMLVLPMGGAPEWSIWLPAAVVAARYLLVMSLVTLPLSKGNIPRVIGAGLNYIVGLLLAILVLLAYWPS